MIGAEMVAKAPPDGYTVLLASVAEVAINQSLYARMTYDPLKDLAPVTLAGFTPLILVVHPSVQARSVKELIGLAKAKPGRFTFASPGNGSVQHLSGELMKTVARVDITHVPYKGGAPAVTDLVGGQISMFFAGMPADIAEYIQASSRVGRAHVGTSVLIPTPQQRRDRYVVEIHDIFHRLHARQRFIRDLN